MSTAINDGEKAAFLAYLYFGSVTDPVKKAVDRAYRDFNRTLTGFGKSPNKQSIRRTAGEILHDALSALQATSFDSQNAFDEWHRNLCMELKASFEPFRFTVGQGQKWINMSFKYLVLLKPSAVEEHWHLSHVPIDRIIIQRLQALRLTPPPLGCAWSAVDSYENYLHWQNWFRTALAGPPMNNEFRLWMRPEKLEHKSSAAWADPEE